MIGGAGINYGSAVQPALEEAVRMYGLERHAPRASIEKTFRSLERVLNIAATLRPRCGFLLQFKRVSPGAYFSATDCLSSAADVDKTRDHGVVGCRIAASVPGSATELSLVLCLFDQLLPGHH